MPVEGCEHHRGRSVRRSRTYAPRDTAKDERTMTTSGNGTPNTFPRGCRKRETNVGRRRLCPRFGANLCPRYIPFLRLAAVEKRRQFEADPGVAGPQRHQYHHEHLRPPGHHRQGRVRKHHEPGPQPAGIQRRVRVAARVSESPEGLILRGFMK